MRVFFSTCALLFSFMVTAAPLNKIVVFGDSLSDNGNLYEYMKHQLPVCPPYYQGRFTNGPVWVELLTQSYYPVDSQQHLFDYAFGGAGVLEDDDDGLFTLDREINSYFLAHHNQADDDSLYVVWIGANNYLAVPDDAEKTIAVVNQGIRHAMQQLVDKGAKHLLVVNVPDLGRIPGARDYDAVSLLTYLSKQHRLVLQQTVSDFQRQRPDVQWLYFDIYTAFNEMLTSPERYGFTNTTDTCYEEVMPQPSSTAILKMVSTVQPNDHLTGDACTGYLFFDPVHPSAAAHQLIAQRVKEWLDANGVEFG